MDSVQVILYITKKLKEFKKEFNLLVSMSEKQTYGIIGAMREEIEPLLSYYEDYETIKHANNEYYLVELKDKRIIICQSKIGKVFAAMTTTILIEKFNCFKILFTGVAGGVNPNLKVGDLIVAEKTCQHDFDITAFSHPHGYIPDLGEFVVSDKNLINLAKKISQKNNIDLKIGTIATGDQFISSKDKKNWIANTFNADAIEMEGASVAQVCENYNIKYLIIRSISDTAEDNAGINFDEFMEMAAQRSAKFLIEIINNL